MYDISVIIACYNAETTILRAIESIQDQNENNIEILIIDDKSTDRSCAIVKEYMLGKPEICLIEMDENNGPGICRNIAIQQAQGTYIIILDADDEYLPNVLQLLILRMQKDTYDVYKLNYAYFNDEKGTIWTSPKPQYRPNVLYGNACEKVALENFYSCAKAYKRTFILENVIKYSEGIYYEDFIFVLKVFTLAETLECIDEVHTYIHVKEGSATRSLHDTNYHIDSMAQALKEIQQEIIFRDAYAEYNIWSQLFERAVKYSVTRAPKATVYINIKRLLILITPHLKHSINAPNTLVERYRAGIITDIHEIIAIQKNGFTRRKIIGKIQKSILYSRVILKLIQLLYGGKTKFSYVPFFRPWIKRDVIIFHGLDYKYTGNSRYMYEKLLRENQKSEIYFITKDNDVAEDSRITPYSLEHFKLLACASVVYLESFQELGFKVGKSTEVRQLWHGTPIKKLYLDSPEPISRENSETYDQDRQKIIGKWDTFCVESDFHKVKAQSSFALDEQKIEKNMYARVEWLLANNSKEVIETLKRKYGIPLDRKVITYLPTWRDYWHTKFDNPEETPFLSRDAIKDIRGIQIKYTITFSNDVEELIQLDDYTKIKIEKKSNIKFNLYFGSPGNYILKYLINNQIQIQQIHINPDAFVVEHQNKIKITRENNELVINFHDFAKIKSFVRKTISGDEIEVEGLITETLHAYPQGKLMLACEIEYKNTEKLQETIDLSGFYAGGIVEICKTNRINIGKENFYIGKLHTYKKNASDIGDVIDLDGRNIETQELILMSDVCISDYSSVIFDFLQLEKEVQLYWGDYELYNEVRGVYEEFSEDFENIISIDEASLVDALHTANQDIKNLHSYISVER